MKRRQWLAGCAIALAVWSCAGPLPAQFRLPLRTAPPPAAGQSPTRIEARPPSGNIERLPIPGPSSESVLTPGRPNQDKQRPATEDIPAGRDAGPGVTLDEIVRVAMDNSPNLREAATLADAAQARAYQASLYPNPQVGTASPQLAGNQTQYNAYVSQDIVTRGKLRLETAAAGRSAQQAGLGMVRTRFELLTTVRSRFYTALAAQSRVEVLNALVVIARQSRDVGQRLLKAGEGNRSDALLLDIELDRALVALENAATMLEADKSQLSAAIGLPEVRLPHLIASLQAPLPDYNLIAVQQGVLSRNAQAQIASVEVARSELLLRRAEVEPFPNPNLLGGYQFQGPGANAPQNQAIYQIQAAMPLFNRNQGNIRAAQASIGTARAQLGRIRNELANLTASAIGRYLAAQQLVDRFEREILPKARETQRLTQQLYGEGQTDFLRVLQAQRTLIEANLGYINAQEIRWTAAAEVAGLLQSEVFP